MGTSVRSRRWRYTVWAPYQPRAFAPKLDARAKTHVESGHVELYSYADDLYSGLLPEPFHIGDLAVENASFANRSRASGALLALLESLHCRARAVWQQGVTCPELSEGEYPAEHTARTAQLHKYKYKYKC